MNSLGYIITGVVSVIFTSLICIASLVCFRKENSVGRKVCGGIFLSGFITLLFITNAFYELVV